MKTAVINCADTGPIESLVHMLEHAGYRCHVPDRWLHQELQRLGGLTLTNEYLQQTMGYEPHRLPKTNDVAAADLFVDVKAHQTCHRLVDRWTSLAGKVLWYRINGGQPEHVIRRDDRGNVIEDCGDEVNPPCPVLTPNQWYHGNDKAYTCWPPFVRFNEYPPRPHLADASRYDRPVCLVHNVNGWGYRDLVEPVRALGVRVFGRGSPDGLVPHKGVPTYLQNALAYVCLKSNDAPGYHLYEAIAAGCPIIAPRRLVWRCRMQDLFEEGATYLPFDRETHDALTPQDVDVCTDLIKNHLKTLSVLDHNRRIARAARARLLSLMWTKEKDGDSFNKFMSDHFGA